VFLSSALLRRLGVCLCLSGAGKGFFEPVDLAGQFGLAGQPVALRGDQASPCLVGASGGECLPAAFGLLLLLAAFPVGFFQPFIRAMPLLAGLQAFGFF
jgi:hypothetical protein